MGIFGSSISISFSDYKCISQKVGKKNKKLSGAFALVYNIYNKSTRTITRRLIIFVNF